MPVSPLRASTRISPEAAPVSGSKPSSPVASAKLPRTVWSCAPSVNEISVAAGSSTSRNGSRRGGRSEAQSEREECGEGYSRITKSLVKSHSVPTNR